MSDCWSAYGHKKVELYFLIQYNILGMQEILGIRRLWEEFYVIKWMK
jgi:hypothetical protein